MKNFFLSCLLVALSLTLLSCANQKESQKEREERLARRQAHDQERQERHDRAKITSLPGLNATELDAIESAENERRQERPADFVYGKETKDIKRPYLNDLNEDDKSTIKTYRSDEKKSQKTSSEWIYGF